MTKWRDHYKGWEQHDGKIVNVKGTEYRIEVRTYHATHPYSHTAIDVSASPINKNSIEYRKIKCQFK